MSTGQRSLFARQLLSSLEAEPLEDGVSHPAEGLIEAALCDVSTEIASRIYETLRELTLDPDVRRLRRTCCVAWGDRSYPARGRGERI